MVKFFNILILLLFAVQSYGDTLEQEAKLILEKHCFECHGTKRESDPNYVVTDYHYLVSPRTTLIVPGRPDKSRIMQRITTQPVEMPPETRRPLNASEIKVLKDWINAGAVSWKKGKRQYIDNTYVSTMIGMDFNANLEESRNFRYVSLVNLYNEEVSDEEIVKGQEAVSKVMNFLAHAQSQVTPTTVLDELGLVIRIDLRDYGWSADDWKLVVKEYPYGDGTLTMRADWFCVNVSQPPLYYELRRVPFTEIEFEKRLGIIPGSVIRTAGITDSQVAIHNRLFKRYETRDGYYWKSLNIKDNNKSSVLDPKNFEPNYSVSLYSLQNHLLGFAVFEKSDENKNPKIFERKDDIDIDAEFDPTKVVGDPHNVPMISCVCCHVNGLQPNIRDVTGGTAIQFIQGDKDRYMRAISKASSSAEPLRSIVERYNRPVDLDCAAKDSGMKSGMLISLIQRDKDLSVLRPLLEGRTVTRKSWQGVHAQRVTQLKER